jgi:hypothetical protein
MAGAKVVGFDAAACVPVADDLSIPNFLKREPAALSESPEGFAA